MHQVNSQANHNLGFIQFLAKSAELAPDRTPRSNNPITVPLERPTTPRLSVWWSTHLVKLWLCRRNGPIFQTSTRNLFCTYITLLESEIKIRHLLAFPSYGVILAWMFSSALYVVIRVHSPSIGTTSKRDTSKAVKANISVLAKCRPGRRTVHLQNHEMRLGCAAFARGGSVGDRTRWSWAPTLAD